MSPNGDRWLNDVRRILWRRLAPHSITITSTGASAKPGERQRRNCSNIVTVDRSPTPLVRRAASETVRCLHTLRRIAPRRSVRRQSGPRSVIDSKDGGSPGGRTCSRKSDSTRCGRYWMLSVCTGNVDHGAQLRFTDEIVRAQMRPGPRPYSATAQQFSLCSSEARTCRQCHSATSV